MTNAKDPDDKNSAKSNSIKIEDLRRKTREETTKIAEKHGISYDRYIQVSKEIKNDLPKTHTDDEAAAVKAVDAEILANTKKSVLRMQNHVLGFDKQYESIRKNLVDQVGPKLNEDLKKSLPKVAMPDIGDYMPYTAQAKPYTPPTPLFDEEALEAIAQSREEERKREIALTKATIEMAETLRQQSEENAKARKFDKKMMWCTFGVATLTLLAAIVVPFLVQ